MVTSLYSAIGLACKMHGMPTFSLVRGPSSKPALSRNQQTDHVSAIDIGCVVNDSDHWAVLCRSLQKSIRDSSRMVWWCYLFSAVDVGCDVRDSIARLCGTSGSKLDCLSPHRMQLRMPILQWDDSAEHDVNPCQYLSSIPMTLTSHVLQQNDSPQLKWIVEKQTKANSLPS